MRKPSFSFIITQFCGYVCSQIVFKRASIMIYLKGESITFDLDSPFL